MYKDKIYNKLQEDRIRNVILDGTLDAKKESKTLKRSVCKMEEAHELDESLKNNKKST